VTLKGEVNYYFQKRDAERAIERLSGVRGVSNLLTVKPQPTPQDLKSQIQKALVRNAQTDASRITVEVQGSTVILRGTVSSYAEKKAAEETAYSSSRVTEVDTRIIVSLPV
jgi:osmotically-inducible protein OsmY